MRHFSFLSFFPHTKSDDYHDKKNDRTNDNSHYYSDRIVHTSIAGLASVLRPKCVLKCKIT